MCESNENLTKKAEQSVKNTISTKAPGHLVEWQVQSTAEPAKGN